MKLVRNILPLLLVLLFIQGCRKDDFPVPPASTVARFTYVIDNEGIAPATVTFNNTSIIPAIAGSALYLWNFGDNTTSTEVSPAHLYTEPGVYNVKLVVITTASDEIKETQQTIIIKDPNASGVPMYYTNGSQVFTGLVNNAPPVMEQLPVVIQGSYGMCIDTVGGHLYITDIDAGAIIRTNLDGSNQTVFRSGLEAPNGLSIDYSDRKIYWDNSSGIQRADMTIEDVSQMEDFVTGQSNDPDGVAVDVANRKVYWINYNGGLWSKNIDGTGEKELDPIPEGGSIIVVGDKVFFDFYNGSGDIHIKSVDLDGANAATLVTGISRVVYGLAYESSENKIYFGDRNLGAIKRCNPDGSDVEVWFQQAGSSPRGISFGN